MNGVGADQELTLMTMMERYSTEEAALAYFEEIRWPDGPVCPHCGSRDHLWRRTPNAKTGTRLGLWVCGSCSETFTVRVGTVMEGSHVPLQKWLLAFYLMCASKTQISALQLQRQLNLGSYRTAHFLCHRIRFALADLLPSDKLDGTVEADETYVGGKVRNKGRGYVKNKTAVVSVVEREGRVRSHPFESVSGKAIITSLKESVSETAVLNTDESQIYSKVGRNFASHDTVNHCQEEYVRLDESGRLATTNTVEGFFGNSKRRIEGTNHHIGRQYVGLYFAELDFKYNTRHATDGERTVLGIRQAEGKRLMLRPSGRRNS